MRQPVDLRGFLLLRLLRVELCEAHGGQLTAQSEPGRGSTFTFTIPLGDVQALAAPAAESGAQP